MKGECWFGHLNIYLFVANRRKVYCMCLCGTCDRTVQEGSQDPCLSCLQLAVHKCHCWMWGKSGSRTNFLVNGHNSQQLMLPVCVDSHLEKQHLCSVSMGIVGSLHFVTQLTHPCALSCAVSSVGSAPCFRGDCVIPAARTPPGLFGRDERQTAEENKREGKTEKTNLQGGIKM